MYRRNQSNIERAVKKIYVNERLKIILKILVRAERAGFQWKMIKLSNIEGFQDFSRDEKQYKWDPLTPELIQFHNWFNSKVKIKGLELVTIDKRSKSR